VTVTALEGWRQPGWAAGLAPTHQVDIPAAFMVTGLDEQERAWFARLYSELSSVRSTLDVLDAYYDGQQRLEQLGLAIPPELARFAVIVNWPRVVVDAVADRLDRKGFRPAAADVGDAELAALWEACKADPDQDLTSDLDYLIYGRKYRWVGTDADRPALITTESPHNVITARRDPHTGRIPAALRVLDGVDGALESVTLALPDRTVWLSRDTGADGMPWQLADRDVHDMGVVPVVPSFRRKRTRVPTHRRLQGTSAMADVIPITDAAARNLTNAQVAQETHAVPQRGVLGATKGDFMDANGNQLTAWEAYFGAVWAMANPNAKTFQFDASSMENFERMTTMYARLASGVTSLPPNYFGLAADDAASADAIRSREARLVKNAETDQVVLGNGDAQALRLAVWMRDGRPGAELDGLETLWHDAGTPTVGQRVDAVVKLYAAVNSAGRPLLPREMAMVELGWSPTKIARALEMLRTEEQDPYLERLTGGGAAGLPAGAADGNA
jgi:Phage portal protein, SPP1 Gp6-like